TFAARDLGIGTIPEQGDDEHALFGTTILDHASSAGVHGIVEMRGDVDRVVVLETALLGQECHEARTSQSRRCPPTAVPTDKPRRGPHHGREALGCPLCGLAAKVPSASPAAPPSTQERRRENGRARPLDKTATRPEPKRLAQHWTG